MLSLTIKDIRKVLEETLSKFYDFVDYGINPTKVMASTKEFRIEFRIYDADFWINIDPAIDSIYIGTRSFGDVDHIDSLQMWLSKPYEYDTEKFDFGWREDLEWFFDGFHAYLEERVERAHNAPDAKDPETKTSIFNNLKDDEGKTGAAVIAAILGGLKDKEDKSKTVEAKPSIFNGLDDQEDRDEYI